MADYRDIRDEIEEYDKGKNVINQYKRKLVESIKKKHVNAFKSVLASGLDVNFSDYTSNYPIHHASALVPDKDSREILTTLIYSDVDLDVADRFGCTPLHIAVGVSLETTVTLLDNGCFIDAQDHAGCTPLMRACSNRSSESLAIIQLLIDTQCNIHLKDDEGFTALHYICKNSQQDVNLRNEIVYKLLYSGLSPILQDNSGKMGLCHELDKFINNGNSVINKEELVVLKTLICAGRNINFTNKVFTVWLTYTLPLYSNIFLLKLFQVIRPILGQKFIRQLHKLYTSLPSCDNQIADIVARYRDMPRSLKSSCRYTIRSNLKERVLFATEDLPLPTSLKKYLLLSDN
ncbi:uncharacterized protein LOC126831549 isoform X1 [Patella vulgata]|uniref:uncharacterized protein LOC126831549 isoform X1 n=1 Tax=Patella vulgata TaxID=6465 RepID=UPI00217F53F8|nr:uncharacterized protein LOC126831549 isoform X1 [Patella vulgata]